MTVEQLMAAISLIAVLVGVGLYISRLATKREVADLRHRMRNFLHVVSNAESFEDLRRLRWRELSDNGVEDEA